MLEGWPQPGRDLGGLEVHAVNTGTLHVPEALLFRGGSLWRRRRIEVPMFLVRHPKRGWIAFDTGLRTRPGDDGREAGLLPLLLQPLPAPESALAKEIEALGVRPERVTHVVLSDLRAHHSGGLGLFTNATVVVSRRERDHAARGGFGYEEVTGVAAWQLVDFPEDDPIGTFPTHVDLFGDGSLFLLETPGSTPGGMSLLVMAPRQPILLAGDLVPVAETFRYAVRPGFPFDAQRWMDSFWRMKKLASLVPELVVVPGCDLAPARAAASTRLAVHDAAEPPEPTPSPTANAPRWQPAPLQSR